MDIVFGFSTEDFFEVLHGALKFYGIAKWLVEKWRRKLKEAP